MPTFRIPAPLRPYSGGSSQIAVQGTTVALALGDLIARYPALREHLYEGENLRSFVNIYLNKEDIRHRDGVDTPLGGDDTLLIIPSIAGGTAAGPNTTPCRQERDA